MSLDKKMKNKKGFTLFELLVSISIIGILVALGTVAYSNAQKKARDARRYQDMSGIQKTFEQWYADHSYSYAACATMGSGAFTDPKNSAPYIYAPVCISTGYVTCAALENNTAGNSSDRGTCGATTCSYTAVTGGAYYCLINAQ